MRAHTWKWYQPRWRVKEGKIKHSCVDRKLSPMRLKWASDCEHHRGSQTQTGTNKIPKFLILIRKIRDIHSMWKNSGEGSRWFPPWSLRQVIKAARRSVEWCSNNLRALKIRSQGGRGHPGINYMDVGGGLVLNLKLSLSVMFLSKGDFPLIRTFISPCSPGWCLITAVHCFFIRRDRQFLALVWKLRPFNKKSKASERVKD